MRPCSTQTSTTRDLYVRRHRRNVPATRVRSFKKGKLECPPGATTARCCKRCRVGAREPYGYAAGRSGFKMLRYDGKSQLRRHGAKARRMKMAAAVPPHRDGLIEDGISATGPRCGEISPSARITTRGDHRGLGAEDGRGPLGALRALVAREDAGEEARARGRLFANVRSTGCRRWTRRWRKVSSGWARGMSVGRSAIAFCMRETARDVARASPRLGQCLSRAGISTAYQEMLDAAGIAPASAGRPVATAVDLIRAD